MRILAGDIGATHCRLGLFELPDELAGRPPGIPPGDTDGPAGARETRVLAYREYPSDDYPGLDPVLHHFLEEELTEDTGATDRPEDASGPPVAAACLGVPCPLDDGRCRLPNLDWELDQARTSAEVEIPNLMFINDFTAVGYGVFEISESDLAVLQEGGAEERATLAVVGAGTGLGTAFLTWCDGRYRVHASEGGHVGFAPRDPTEGRLRAFLADRYGRASRERVVSGPGLVDLYRFRVRSEGDPPCPDVAAALEGEDDAAAVISGHGMEDADPACGRALSHFVRAFGAVAGDVALACEARGGLCLAGGIAPKILDRLREGEFLRAFRDKGRMADLVESVPLSVITNPRVGILGSVAVARSHASGRDGPAG